MRNKPDDRRDNVDRIQENIDMTIHNIELAEEVIAKTGNPKTKRTLIDKNQRRQTALEGMHREIQDEENARERKNN